MADELKRLEQWRKQQEQHMAKRDGLILAAKAAGAPVTHIAAAVGLDRTQVHRIIRDAADN